MTPDERAERHSLSLLLPSFYEERIAASERLAARISARKKVKIKSGDNQ
jgi:hypothetical protein